ncbi:MFS transporter [Catenulispora sp. NL8]|uniref:MFS transporter n=1 Tax=Catenulispora pinistramenti TaxID=2705254 RepID=A0ABS5KL50_9ACTN|nr:MFS transporter [Catenulispora pinistramenti]MBS2546761.1 MFS transporter [Catenulispora pinistramenti]
MSIGVTMSNPVSLWRNRNFMLFLTAQTLSSVGDSFSYVAIPLLVLHTTGSIVQMGLVTGVTGVASIGTGLVAGVIADRVNRQALLMVCDIARFLLYGLIPVVWLFSPQLWFIYVVVPLGAVFGMLFRVGYVTVVPKLVSSDQITEANGRLYSSYAVAAVGGPTAAGFISGIFNPSVAIAVDSVSFAVSAIGLLLLRRRTDAAERAAQSETAQTETAQSETAQSETAQSETAQTGTAQTDSGSKSEEKRPARQGIRTDFLIGAKFLWANEILRPLTIRLSILTFLTYGVTDLIVFHIKHDLKHSDTFAGYVLSAGTVGTFIASSLVARLRKRFGFGKCWTVAFVLCGAAVAGIGLTGVIPVVALLAMVMLACTGVAGICSMSFRQEVTPSDLLGRVTAAFWTIHSALGPIGAAVLTAAASGYGVRSVGLVAGIVISLTAVTAVATPMWRGVKPQPDEADPTEQEHTEQTPAEAHADSEAAVNQEVN